MITNISQDFFAIYKSVSKVDLEKVQKEDKKETIQAQICRKQAQDLYSSLSKVNTIMVETKQNYFSNAAYSYSAFTDQQRNQFNHQIKSSLDETNIKITQFKEAIESIQCHNVTEKEHFRGLAICLYQLFKKSSSIYRQFLQFYEKRKQKFQNALTNINNQNKKEFKMQKQNNLSNRLKIERKISSIDDELEEESKAIYMERAAEQQKIEDTKKTLEQINEVLDKMSNKVLEQELLTSSFKDIGEIGLQNIQKANKNLTQANTLSSEGGKYWTFYFLFLAFSLLILDFLKS